jgi:putative DNA methylase
MSATPYKKKLIEVALPLEDINREAAREKSIRHGHPSTLHLWWARRPLAACRAVLFASLVDDPSECEAELMVDSDKRKAAEKLLAAQHKAWEARKAVFDNAAAAGVPRSSNPLPGLEPKLEDILVETERERLFDIIRELVKWENSNDERVLNRARYEIARSVSPPGTRPPTESAALLAFLAKHAPPIYDPFCGGGSIPLEAQRLGLEAHASDLNPVPVLITKALIEVPPKFAGKPPVNPQSRKKLSASGSWKGAAGLAEDIRYYGQWMRDEAEKRIGHLYPKAAVIQERDGNFRHASPSEIRNQKSEIQNLTVIAWLWARTVASPNPAAKGAQVPLARSFCISNKPGNKAWVEPVVDQGTMS